MQTVWLILGSLALPFFWGWAVNRLLDRLWPDKQPPAAARDDKVHPLDPLADYQI